MAEEGDAVNPDQDREEDLLERKDDIEGMKTRAEIFTHAVKAALLINGGAAISVVGFLPKIWENAPGLVLPAVISLGVFAGGALLAATINYCRYKTSLADKARNIEEAQKWRARESGLLIGSWAAFAVAVVILVAGTIIYLALSGENGPLGTDTLIISFARLT